MAVEIGSIKTLIGTAVATSADGTSRNLQVGDKIYASDIVTTGSAGAVEIEFTDGSVMALGRSSQALLDNEVFDPEFSDQNSAAAESDVDALQQAILEGSDPTQAGEATAAGAGAQTGGDEGTTAITVEFLAPEVLVTSGFETTGPNISFLDSIEDSGLFDDVPTAIDDGAAILVGDEFSILGAEHTLSDDAFDPNSQNDESSKSQSLQGDLISNDDFGTDGPGGLVSVSYTGGTESVTGTLLGGVATFQSPFWTLTVNPDGSYVFTQTSPYAHDEGSDIVQETFSYTIADADGDTASATLRINILDDVPEVMTTETKGVAYEFTMTNHDEVSSAGYHSSYGYYIKDAVTGEPTTGVVVWDDVHDTDTTSTTVTGYSPEQVGFFLIANGDNQNASLTDNTKVTFKFVDSQGQEVAVGTTGGQWQAFSESGALKGVGSHVIFDDANLNKDGQDHVEDNYLTGNQNWEDLQIPTGDGDFNDVNVNVEWTQVAVSGDAVDSVSFGGDGPGSIDFLLGDVPLFNGFTSNGHAVTFEARDSNNDGHNDQLVGQADGNDVLTIGTVLDAGKFDIDLFGPLETGGEDTNVTIDAKVQVTDSDGDTALANLQFNINVHDFVTTPPIIDVD